MRKSSSNAPSSRRRGGNSRLDIAVIGECMIELAHTARGALRMSHAGDTYNTAVYLRRLLPSAAAAVHYVSALGRDTLSDAMLAAWRAEGLETDCVGRDPRRLPGLYYITTDARGERSFWYWRGESAARRLLAGDHTARVARCLRSAALVYLSGITLAILSAADRARLVRLLRDARRAGARIVFDSNFRARLWRSRKAAAAAFDSVYRLTDLALVSFDNEREVYGDATLQATTTRLAGLGIEECVVKNGPDPCLARLGDDIWLSGADARVRAVDTTGAGDAFNAAYIAARLRGHKVPSALRAGHALAGKVVTRSGAVMPLQSTPSLEQLLQR